MRRSSAASVVMARVAMGLGGGSGIGGGTGLEVAEMGEAEGVAQARVAGGGDGGEGGCRAALAAEAVTAWGRRRRSR